MLVFFICLIIFISLGLPDGILGSIWPTMSQDIGVDPGVLGFVGAIVFIFSFISTYFYPRMIQKYSLSKIIIVSITFLLIGFICYLLSYNHIFLFLGAAFLGLGAGCIDTGVNEYAMKNFSVKHINILHAFYAVGVTIGALISSFVFYINCSWEVTLVVIIAMLFLTSCIVFIYRKALVLNHSEEESLKQRPVGIYLIFSFYFTYTIEIVIGMFISSFIFFELNMDKTIASLAVFMFWFGLFWGRIAIGIIARFLDKKQILISSMLICIFAAIGLIIFSNVIIVLLCVFFIGFGLGPIYPTMMAQNAHYYEEKELSSIVSMQMMGFMFGGIILPSILGIIFSNISYYLLPVTIIVAMLILITNFYFLDKINNSQK